MRQVPWAGGGSSPGPQGSKIFSPMSIERSYSSAPVSLDSRPSHGSGPGPGRRVRGYGAVFNKRSANFGTESAPVFEIIAPGAFDGVLKDDVRALINHDQNRVLARSKNGQGTLKLGIDAVGLWYEFDAPATSAGDDIVVSLKRGDVDQSSFAFSVAPGGDTRTRASDGAVVRTIKKVQRLFDVSVVTYPAYVDAEASVRATDAAPPALNPFTQTGANAARFGLRSFVYRPSYRPTAW